MSGGGGCPELEAIKDPHARAAMKQIFDRLSAVEGKGNTPAVIVAPIKPVNGAGLRATNVANAAHAADVMNLQSLRTLANALFQSALNQVGAVRTAVQKKP